MGPAEHLDEPLYAINWFNTRTRLLYQIYTILAAYPVSRVQSRLWLKARHRSLLSGSERDQRAEALLEANFGTEDGQFLLPSRISYVSVVSWPGQAT